MLSREYGNMVLYHVITWKITWSRKYEIPEDQPLEDTVNLLKKEQGEDKRVIFFSDLMELQPLPYIRGQESYVLYL